MCLCPITALILNFFLSFVTNYQCLTSPASITAKSIQVPIPENQKRKQAIADSEVAAKTSKGAEKSDSNPALEHASAPKTDCLPLALYESINVTLNVPQILLDILPRLTLDPKRWNIELGRLLLHPFTKNQMADVLKKPPSQFTPKEIIMAFWWFFRSAATCNGVRAFSQRLNEIMSSEKYCNQMLLQSIFTKYSYFLYIFSWL